MTRVLIVDDNLLIRTLLRAALDHGGYTVAGEAKDGVETLSRVGEVHPDVVILDLVMPRKDGLTALAELRNYYPTLPVVICSAALTEPRVVRALQLGAKGFIAKPFDRDAVVEAVEAALAGAGRPATVLRRAVPQLVDAHAMPDERRNFPRIDLSIPVVLEGAPGSERRTVTVNVSGGGMLLATEPLDHDELVGFSLELGAGEPAVRGRARPVRGNAQAQQAFAFEEISLTDHERLVRFLARSAPAAVRRAS